MQDNKDNKSGENTRNDLKEQKKPLKKPAKGTNEDFKRKYFEYYDDIKISDRQDW